MRSPIASGGSAICIKKYLKHGQLDAFKKICKGMETIRLFGSMHILTVFVRVPQKWGLQQKVCADNCYMSLLLHNNTFAPKAIGAQ